jgi:hypothetical protein
MLPLKRKGVLVGLASAMLLLTLVLLKGGRAAEIGNDTEHGSEQACGAGCDGSTLNGPQPSAESIATKAAVRRAKKKVSV